MILGSCKTTVPEASAEKEKVVSRYEILRHIESDNDLKWVIYNFNRIRMEEVRNFTEQPVQLIVSMNVLTVKLKGCLRR